MKLFHICLLALWGASTVLAATPSVTCTTQLNFADPATVPSALMGLTDATAEPTLLADGSLAVYDATDGELVAKWNDTNLTLTLQQVNVTYTPAVAGTALINLPAGSTLEFGRVSIRLTKSNSIKPIILSQGALDVVSLPGGTLEIRSNSGVAADGIYATGNLSVNLTGQGTPGHLVIETINNQGTGLSANGGKASLALVGGSIELALWERAVHASTMTMENCQLHVPQASGNRVHFPNLAVSRFEILDEASSLEIYSYCQGLYKFFSYNVPVTIPESYAIFSGTSQGDINGVYTDEVTNDVRGKRYLKVVPGLAKNTTTGTAYPSLKEALRHNADRSPIELFRSTDEVLTISENYTIIGSDLYAPNVTYLPEATCQTSGNWSSLSTWASGSKPQDGMSVRVVGEGVVLTVDETLPFVPDITLEGGATLQINATQPEPLPRLTCDELSTLNIGNGTDAITVRFRENCYHFNAVEQPDGSVKLSTLRLNPNATAHGLRYFKNVDCYLNGTFMTDQIAARKIIFGDAAKNETSYLGLDLSHPGYLTHQWSLYFAQPTSGGRIKAIRPWRIRNFNQSFERGGDWGCAFVFGRYNPSDEPIEISVENSNFRHALNTDNNVYIAGGITLKLGTGSYLGAFPNGTGKPYNKREDYWNDSVAYKANRSVHIIDKGQIIVEGGTLSSGRLNTPASYGWNISPSVEGHASIIYRSGRYRVWGCSAASNGKGRFVVEGDCHVDLVSGMDKNVLPRSFEGFASIDLADNATLRFSILNNADRTLPITKPITGNGAITVVGTNSTTDITAVVFRNPANSYIGTMASENSAGPARFFLDNGVTWSGVMRSSACGVTNLTTATAISEVNVPTLLLDDNSLLLRIFADHTADCVHIGEGGLQVENNGSFWLAGEGVSTALEAPYPVIATRPRGQLDPLPMARSEAISARRTRTIALSDPTREGITFAPIGVQIIIR